MAQAFVGAADLGDNGGGTTSLTVAYTVGGSSNRLWVLVVGDDGGFDDITSVTYAGTPMGLVDKVVTGAGERNTYLYTLANPATGSHNVVISATNAHYILAGAADYSGVSTGSLDAHVPSTDGASEDTYTDNITTVADNCWVVTCSQNAASSVSGGTGATLRAYGAAYTDWGFFDSNAVVHPAGTFSATTTMVRTAANPQNRIMASTAPTGAAAQVQVWSATHINGNLTGGGTTTVDYTVDVGGSSSIAFADTGVSTGKHYWEARLTGASVSPFINGGFGIGNTTSSVADGDYLGLGWDSLGLYFNLSGVDASWFINNSVSHGFSLGFTVASGDVLGFALDLVNNTIWFRDVTQASGWYGTNAGGDNPATNTNGFSLVQTNFTVTSAPVVPAALLFNAGDELVGFFSPASWSGAAPSGFIGFDTTTLTPISGNWAGRGVLAANRARVLAHSASRYSGTGTFAATARILARSASRYSGAGTFAATATISSRISALLAAFAGSGAIAMPTSLTVPSSVAFPGRGSFFAAPRGQLAGSAQFAGTGSLNAVLTVSGRTDISAAFSGAASLTLRRLTARGSASAAYSGAGTISGDALSGTPSPPSGTTSVVDQLGNQIVDQLGNIVVTEFQAPTGLIAHFAGIGSLAVSRPKILATGLAQYFGAGNFVANLTQHSVTATGTASFSGSGSLSTRIVARLRGNARFSGVGVWSTGLTTPAVLARCFGRDIGIFLPPTIRDAPRAGPAIASDAALDTAPSLWLKDVEVYFVAGNNAARGLVAASDAAIGKATLSDVPATSIVVSEL